MTRPDGWVVLNADDPYVAGVARTVRARVAWFSVATRRPRRIDRALARGQRAYLIVEGAIVEAEGAAVREIVGLRDVPVAFGGLARHNVANALAAVGAARALGATLEEVAAGLRDFRPSTDSSPGRLNVFRVPGAAGDRLVIVDFAHNEAGVRAILDVAEGLAAGVAGDGRDRDGSAASRSARPGAITVIVGMAGDRPDDTLRGVGRIAAERADRVVIKETLKYLRGRSRESVLGEIRAGMASVLGTRRAADVDVYESESTAVRGELTREADDAARTPRVIVLLCHEDRAGVFGTIAELGGRPLDGEDLVTAASAAGPTG